MESVTAEGPPSGASHMSLNNQLPPPFPPLLRAAWCALFVTTTATGSALAQPADGESDAGSDVADRCFAAHEEGQVWRAKGHYVTAREKLLECARRDCPAVVRTDCANWVAELTRSTPSVVFAVRVGDADRSDVRVFVDGVPRLERLDGRPVQLDPGDHHFRFQLADGSECEVTISLRVGEQNRPVEVVFPTHGPPPEIVYREVPPRSRRIPTSALSLGTASLLSGIVAASLYGSARINYEQARRECEPLCSERRQDRIRNQAAAGDVLMVVSITAAASAAVVWLLRTPKPRPTTHHQRRRSAGAWDKELRF